MGLGFSQLPRNGKISWIKCNKSWKDKTKSDNEPSYQIFLFLEKEKGYQRVKPFERNMYLLPLCSSELVIIDKYPTHDFKGRQLILHFLPITRPHFHWRLFCMTPELESFSVCQKEGTPMKQTLSGGLVPQVLHLLISSQTVTWLQVT